MGYNGGTNKRGYYRRFNGMYSKSSYRSGEKILSNFILGGVGLLATGAKAISKMSDNMPYDNLYKEEHLNLRIQKAKYIICGILSIICPIAGYISHAYYGWWLFFSMLIFGGISVIINCITALFETNFTFGKYIYEDELEHMTLECRKILKTHKIFMIAASILNIYPLIFIISEIITPPPYGEIKIGFLSILLTIFNIGLPIAFAGGSFYDLKTLNKTLSKNTRRRRTKTAETGSTTNKNAKSSNSGHDSSAEEDETLKLEIHLPKISGEYVEPFYGQHSKLHIRPHSADIQFYFPGPDLRYNGTFFQITENEIDAYIQAYKINWLKAKELYEKAQELPNTELKITGEKNMEIWATNKYFTIYLHKYHLPIATEKEYKDIINQLHIAKLRIEEIRQKLFKEEYN